MSYLKMFNLRFPELGGLQANAHLKMGVVEKLVRVILCAGFIVVLVIEISLLIHALRIFG